ncbi:O-fucosyltransferase family protein [Phanerochaete sordida]|uniref:O-fucosyltransferase family protein n=1 Tax=Phanerochaete sordida TaxID=48140 RepID=A0A9P3G5P3_9APHY|nr:O-fucosyltransferase family protein [Phanerochaete sordida]
MKQSPRLPVHRRSSASPRRLRSRAGSLQQSLTLRRVLLGAGLVAALVYLCVAGVKRWKKREFERNKPPLYEKYHHAELALPQHDTSDPFAGGKKYLWVNNHVSGLGWGNYLEDLIMNAQVAYSSGRSFVFDNFTWNRDNSEYSGWDSKLIPSQIPLSALISGPLLGGAFVQGDRTPLAVHQKYFEKICPNPTIVKTEDVRPYMGPEHPTALKILQTWTEYLKGIDDPCVEVARDSERIFSFYIYGEKWRLLPVWPVLSASPVLRLLGWAPLVHAAFAANRALFAPVPPLEPYAPPPALAPLRDPYVPLPGLLVLHVRRGDYEDHCAHLARWGASFNAFNAFDALPDAWETPADAGGGEVGEESMRLYMRRCLPSIPDIVRKVAAVRAAHEGIRDVYVMTNAKAAWADALKAALRGTGGLDRVATSRDLVLDREQKYVAQAVDMLIGQRAQVLIGNGFSSLTSDIVMMRMARKLPPQTNRFW